MFGGLAAYLHERQMLVLVEPTKTGRWKWHGVLVCTDREQHAAISADFPALMPHSVLRKWLYIDTTHGDFESTMAEVASGCFATITASASCPRVSDRKHERRAVM